jgi:hypothetical protein
MMTKANYLATCMSQSIHYLQLCLDHPSSATRPIHAKLIRIALRKKRAMLADKDYD